jgi:hypothetical protein
LGAAVRRCSDFSGGKVSLDGRRATLKLKNFYETRLGPDGADLTGEPSPPSSRARGSGLMQVKIDTRPSDCDPVALVAVPVFLLLGCALYYFYNQPPLEGFRWRDSAH